MYKTVTKYIQMIDKYIRDNETQKANSSMCES